MFHKHATDLLFTLEDVVLAHGAAAVLDEPRVDARLVEDVSATQEKQQHQHVDSISILKQPRAPAARGYKHQ